MRVLVTGFEPFAGEGINPSYEAVKKLQDYNFNFELYTAEIPTVFYDSLDNLNRLLDDIKPKIVICVGQAGGRSNISLERVAINVDDARIKDNSGNRPIDTKIKLKGKNAYFSKLPIKAIVKELRINNIPATVSNTAGTFVCNHLMYGLLHLINTRYPEIKGGFIHVPYIPGQVVDKKEESSMSLSNITKSLSIAVKTSIAYEDDIIISDGKLS
jgi:pyroglutamyl-peptidase